jgi:ABC-type branched-subunit amino acid transport system substrate-binding protein
MVDEAVARREDLSEARMVTDRTFLRTDTRFSPDGHLRFPIDHSYVRDWAEASAVVTDARRDDRKARTTSPAPRPAARRATARARLRRALAAAAPVVLLTAGCGAVPGSAGGSRDPVTVMTWAPEGTGATNMPGMPAVAEVFAKDVNAHGGINGRELKVITCNERNSREQAADCARQAVAAKAVAVVGSYSQYGSEFMPVLESAGIPYIGGYGVTTEEFTSALSYPVNGGTPTLLAGDGRELAGHGCERVALVRPDTAAGDLLPLYLDSGLRSQGLPKAIDIRAPEDATDYTPQARRAIGADLPGNCVVAALGDRTATFLDSYDRLGARNTRLSSVLGSIRQSLVDSTGGYSSPLEGVYATGWYPPQNDPRWEPMRQAVRTHAFSDHRIDTTDPGDQTTWIACTVLKEVAGTVAPGRLDAGTLRRALDRDRGVSTGGLTPKLSWRDEDALPLSDNVRIVNTAVTFQVVRNGQLVAEHKGFVDVRRQLESGADSQG